MSKNKILLSVIIISLLYCLKGFAQEKRPLTKDQIENLESLDILRSKITEMHNSIDYQVKQRNYHCIKAFGNHTFCECINNNLPWSVSFLQYVQITSLSKELIGYGSMNREEKAIIDKTLSVREKCVN